MNGTRCAIKPEMKCTSRAEAIQLGNSDGALRRI
jgi:hypothetical protein